MRVKYRHGKLVIWGEKGMKVRQIVRIILVVIVLVIVGIFIRERMHGLLHEMEEGGVTVGESADGPTSAFFAGKLGGDNEEVEDMSQDEKAELKLIIADMEVEVLWEDYGSNSWAYTRLGKIQNLSEQELTELLSNGDVTMTIYE